MSSKRTGTCSVQGCGRAAWDNNTMCPTHKAARRKGLDVSALQIRPYTHHTSSLCIAPGCTRSRHDASYCPTHYRRRATGEVDWNRPVQPRRKIGQSARIKGTQVRVDPDVNEKLNRCALERQITIGTLLSEIITTWARQSAQEASKPPAQESEVSEPKSLSSRKRAAHSCSVVSCSRKYYARGWCHSHYMQNRKFGKVTVDVGKAYRMPAGRMAEIDAEILATRRREANMEYKAGDYAWRNPGEGYTW